MAKAKAPALTIRSKVDKPKDNEDAFDYLRKLERLRALKLARDDILAFAQLMMPSLDDPLDVNRSQYQAAAHHKLMAEGIHKQVKGHKPRWIVTMPPRHGKTQLVTKFYAAWRIGRYPDESNVVATYNSELAGDFGREVRAMVQSETFMSIFPEVKLRKGSAAADRLVTEQNGTTVFVGRGQALSGRGAHCLICDDLVKDASEADSPTVREKMWQWFTQVAMTRLMSSVGTSVMLTFTRWHEDDIIGRLTNPDNPCYDPDIARQWEITNCPFFAEDDDPLGRKVGELLWPERFDREFGETQQRLNPRAFQALYQQNPSAQEGNYFKKSWLHTFEDAPRKEELNIFAASDHAVATGETNDKTAMVIAGVDKHGQIYVLDCIWGRFDAAQQVEKMIELMKKWEPRIWWAEKQHMGQALGPFLRKRKLEEGVSCVIEEVHASKDKEARARSLQGMMADNRVFFPYRCWWRMAAEDEILKFPRSTYDDFVDALSWLGMKIQQLYAVREPKKLDAPAPRTLEWIKRESKHQRRMGDMKRIRGGW